MRTQIDSTFLAVLASLAPALGCLADDGVREDLSGPTTVIVGEDTDGYRDTSSGERSATVQGFTLTMNAHAIVGVAGGQQTVTIKGTASRTITSVFSYVPDDAFGEAVLTGARTFEIRLDEAHEINTLLSGAPILVSIDTLSGAVQHFDAAVTLGARFARFEGTTRIVVDPIIRPIYANDPVDPLRYRGRFTTTSDHSAPEVFAPDAGDPVVTQRAPRETTFDWQFAPFSLAYDPPTDPMTFRAAFTNALPLISTKHAGIDLKVVQLGLTTEDAYEAFPPPACTEPVASCMLADPDAEDFAACGDYREVRACTHGGLCEFATVPVTLTPIDTSSLDPAIDGYNDGCPNGGSWCGLDTVRAYRLPECPDEEVTSQLLFQLVADQTWTDDTYGDYVEDPGIDASMFFASSPSSGGVALRDAVDALAGTSFSRGWVGSSEYPCHNCHNWYTRVIAWYPSTRTVVVLDGFYGWDS